MEARRITIRKPGGLERMELVRYAAPEPGPGEVAIDVAAIGVNFADIAIREGLYRSAKVQVGWPITPGFEVAGTVRAVGAGVERFNVGDRVASATRFGGYASAVSAPEAQVFALPEGWSFERAAGFSVVHLTAWYALELAAAREDGVVLVHAAAGGVGQAALALARRRGLRTIGVVGNRAKVEVARERGATHVVDRSSSDLWAEVDRLAPKGLDAVLDSVGGRTLREGYRRLAPQGRVVTFGFHGLFTRGSVRPSWARMIAGWLATPRFNPFDLVERNRSVLGFNLSYLFDRVDRLRPAIDELLDAAAQGQLDVAEPSQVLPLEQAGEAHRLLQTGETVGKLVLSTGG